MLTIVGTDRPGIVARITEALYQNGWTLGEASMMRLGGSFTIMMMVSSGEFNQALEPVLQPVIGELGLRMHVDAISGGLHQHVYPNIQVRVSGADRTGIVAQVTGALADAGFNILELQSDVAGDADSPLYIMCIQGVADQPVEVLQAAVDQLELAAVDVKVSPVDTMIG